MSDLNLKTTHVIFDLDGLLLNTEDIYGRVFDEMAMRFVHRHFSCEAKRKVQGRCLTEGEQLFKSMYGVKASLEEIDQAAHQLLAELLPQADLTPGAERLVKHLYNNEIPMAIATGSDEEGFMIKTAKNRSFFEKHFDHVVLSTDPAVKNGKPAPDIFLAAASRFKEQPPSLNNYLVFDDAYLGIKGALAAKMPCVWVPSIPDMDTTTLPATLVLKTLEDFVPHHFGIPAYDGECDGLKVPPQPNKRVSMSPNIAGRDQ